METQLELKFKVGGHYYFAVDGKNDFVGYNLDGYQLTEEKFNPNTDLIPLTYKEETPIIKRLKSEVWSSNARWFFVMQDEGIYLFDVYSDEFWLCLKHTNNFIKEFLENVGKKKK